MLNTGVLFSVLNAVAMVALHLWPDRSALPHFDDAALAELYPDYPLAVTRRLLAETWGREYAYEPFTQFREGSVNGEFVTVHYAGFRPHATDQPWPPPESRSLFFFGGSTTFGYGEKDDATLPFFAQAALRRHCNDDGLWIYNFARSNYFSSQERILFEQLLVSGHEPAAAVFVDGVNEFSFPDDQPKFTQRLAYLMAENDLQLLARAVGTLPLVELLQRVSGLRTLYAESQPRAPVDVETITSRWFANRSLIRSAGAVHGVPTFFVWQPSPTYSYDLSDHVALAALGGSLPHLETMRTGYEVMARRLATAGGFDDVLWLGNSAPDLGRPLYVDRFHYSGLYAEFLGESVARWLATRLCRQLDANSGG